MIMRLLIVIIVLMLSSCYESKISNNKDKVIVKKRSIEESQELEKIKEDIKSDEFVYLFFNRANFQPQKIAPKKPAKPVEIETNDYKVIVDWLIEDGSRQIKLKNLKTGKIYIITEGDKSGEVILLERKLFHYKFKIDNTIIKVKR